MGRRFQWKAPAIELGSACRTANLERLIFFFNPRHRSVILSATGADATASRKPALSLPKGPPCTLGSPLTASGSSPKALPCGMRLDHTEN